MNSPALLALFSFGAITLAQESPDPRPPRPEPGGSKREGGPAADARAGRPGPWDRDVVVYRTAPDGKMERVTTFERAGVPTVARLGDGRLIAAHQHFPADFGADFDKVAVHFSDDDGRTWSPPQVIQLTGLPAGMRFPFDPTLVPLPDGRVRIYFTSLHGRRFDESKPAIYSAISRDGVKFEFEPGVRFAIEGRPVIDCAVALHRGVFHLYSPDNGTDNSQRDGERPRDGVGYHATSSDGLSFLRQPDAQIGGRRRWLGNAQSDGRVITFYGTGEGLWMATSEDGATWTAANAPAIRGGDPGAVATRDGGLIVVITGEPRPGTPRPPRREGPGGPNGFGPLPQPPPNGEAPSVPAR
jgi:hypothetical protein